MPITRTSRATLRLLSLGLGLAIQAAAAGAIDIYVTRYDDPAPDGCENAAFPAFWDCSLREAVIATRDLPSDDRIFLSAGTYELTRAGASENASLTGDLDTLGNLELIGAGATMTTIDANGIDRILHLSDSDAPGDDVVQISGIAFTGGNPPDASQGSAIFASRVGLNIDSCEVFDNGDQQSEAGAIYVTLFVDLEMRDTTVYGNAAGGISIIQSDAQILNSTFSGNGTFEMDVNGTGAVLCRHCTIRDSAGDDEIEVHDTGAVLQLVNSAILGGCGTFGGGVIQSLGGNLESPDDSCGLGANDLENIAAPGYGSLLDNGGETPTHFPSLVSPGVGNALAAHCATNDQRGVQRTNEDTCEIGSVERSLTRTLTPLFRDGFQQGGNGAWSDTQGG